MTEPHGLSQREVKLIHGVLRRCPEVTGAVLYGSRAEGTHRPESDVDLAIQGDLDGLRAEAIASELDELPLPYRFDVQAYAAIQSAPLREAIRRNGVVIYGQWEPQSSETQPAKR